MFCRLGWWMQVHWGVSAGVWPALFDTLIARLGCWSFLSSKQASESVLLSEGPWSLCLEISMKGWEQEMSPKEFCREEKRLFHGEELG